MYSKDFFNRKSKFWVTQISQISESCTLLIGLRSIQVKVSKGLQVQKDPIQYIIEKRKNVSNSTRSCQVPSKKCCIILRKHTVTLHQYVINTSFSNKYILKMGYRYFVHKSMCDSFLMQLRSFNEKISREQIKTPENLLLNVT